MRFHFGVSISWYKLKKYIIPLLIGFLLSFGLGKITYVYASNYDYELNLNSTYDILYPDPELVEPYLENDTSCSYSELGISNCKEFIDYVNNIDYTDYQYYPVFVIYTPNRTFHEDLSSYLNNHNYIISLSAIPNSSNPVVSYYGRDYSSGATDYSYFEFSLSYDTGSLPPKYTSDFSSFLTCMYNGNFGTSYPCTNYTFPNVQNIYSVFTDTYNSYGSLPDTRFRFSNSTSYGWNQVSGFIYSSPKPVIYHNVPVLPSRNFYWDTIYIKSLSYHDKPIEDGSNLLTYEDYKESAKYTYKSRYDKLSYYYISDLSLSDLEDFELNVKFNTEYENPSEYFNFNNIMWEADFYGRKNNSSYYTYEEITCNINFSYSLTVLENGTVSWTYSNSQPCTTDLSAYDKFYIRISPIYDFVNFDPLVLFPSVKLNHGKYYRGFIAGADLFEYFDDYNLNNRLLLSQNNNNDYLQTATVLSRTKSWTASSYDIGTSSTSRYDTEPIIQNYRNTIYYGFDITYGRKLNTGALIFGLPYSSLTSSNLYVFINKDSMMSLNSGSNDDYYFYDSSGNILQDTIINDFDYVGYNDNFYDLSYYFNKINNFIDDLVDSLNDFSNLIQHSYNTLPFILRSFIDLVFILVLLYFTFKLIGK